VGETAGLGSVVDTDFLDPAKINLTRPSIGIAAAITHTGA